MAIQSDIAGSAPEKVLVLELVGSVDDFVRAVRRIGGLEWLVEDEFSGESDDDFFIDPDAPSHTLPAQLFMVMTDAAALDEILRLWTQFTERPDERFPRGYAKWRDVFAHLRTIRFWDAQDRLARTGVIEDWRARVSAGEEIVPAEVELWYRSELQARGQAEDRVRAAVVAAGGAVVAASHIAEISYHAVLAQVPVGSALDIIERHERDLVRIDEVMFFRPVGQALGIGPQHDPDEAASPGERVPDGEPLVALLDGLPLDGHIALRGRITVDDPDDFGSDYPVNDRRHGTAMASLIVHGDLAGAEQPLATPLYVRPILRPDPRAFRGFGVEAVPDDALFVDIVHRAIRRIFDGGPGDPPAAPSVRVINLSVCDRALAFDRRLSPVARLLDWLSWEYGVLFVVSAGNHPYGLELLALPSVLDALPADELQAATIEAMLEQSHLRRILSPAESINALTVAASHSDASGAPAPGTLRDLIANSSFPSPVNPLGLGFRRSVKPDVLAPGGRQLFRDVGFDAVSTTVRPEDFVRPPGQRVASPGASGETTAVAHTVGTSNAAAVTSRAAATLLQLGRDVVARAGLQLNRDVEPLLAKALLVHSAAWGDARADLESILRGRMDGRTTREFLARFLGYGRISPDRVQAGSYEKATLFGWSNLSDGEADRFELPLPPSLAGSNDWRRLTVTLAWFTPVNVSHRAYRRAHLWLSTPETLLEVDHRDEAHWQTVQRGTLQHEIFDGDEASAFVDGDSISIQVNCRADAGALGDQIPYALVVSLETAPGVGLPIYDEVEARIRTRVAVRSRT
jgi:hypothetical protein